MRRRHKVALRPRVARERRARGARVFVVIAAVGLLAVVARRAPRGAFTLAYWTQRFPAPGLLCVDRVTFVGVPNAALPAVQAALAPREGRAWAPGASGRVARELRERFGFLEAVSLSRDWRGRSVTISAILQTPVAKVFRPGRPRAWLAPGGRVFEAPEGTYPPVDAPEVELPDSADAALPALADFLTAAAQGLPGKLERATRASEGDWELLTADGTRIQWGKLDWTQEKLSRLREVLGDAGRRFGAGLTADLRYFEDGKILVRPAGDCSLPACRGAMATRPAPPRAGQPVAVRH